MESRVRNSTCVHLRSSAVASGSNPGLQAPLPDELAASTVLVLGLGRAGGACARFLLSRGAHVLGFDENRAILCGKDVARLKKAGLVITSRPETAKADWAVVSPGMGENHPLVGKLRKRGIQLVDELDLASQYVRGPVIAVTGTNGKSTTTALIARMLEAAGRSVFFGGNLAPGRPFSEALMLSRKDVYVVEASSFQLERARWFKPKVGVILNITADHLNRHGSIKRYAECKFRMLDRQDEFDFAVLNADDQLVRAAARRGDGAVYWFSTRRRASGAYVSRGSVWFDGRRVIETGKIRLIGAHNVQNALAAVTAAKLLGASNRPIVQVLQGFAGLPHRLEFVVRRAGVRYLNNSMCTNPAAGARSLEAVAADSGRKVVLIAGGREKQLPTDEYSRAMAKHAKRVFLIGESQARIARELERLQSHRYSLVPDLAAAVAAAAASAKAGDTVLFSPGFASFDQFADFEARGEAFRREVAALG